MLNKAYSMASMHFLKYNVATSVKIFWRVVGPLMLNLTNNCGEILYVFVQNEYLTNF